MFAPVKDTFLYFAYGSNLLKKRIHINNPSAVFIGIGRLDNHLLDFMKYSDHLRGTSATIVPIQDSHVWGAVWRIQNKDMPSLDCQEGVDKDIYYVKHAEIITPYIGKLLCRIYEHTVIPLPRGDNDEIPIEFWPSWTYKEVILLGAEEHNLPEYYIENLKNIKHNGEQGCFYMACLLKQYAKAKPCECKPTIKILRKPLKLDLKQLRKK